MSITLNIARLLILVLYCKAAVGAGAAERSVIVDLVGTIRGLDEKPIRNASVSIYRSFPTGSRSTHVNGSTADLDKTATTDERGQFRIPALEAGAVFQVLFQADGFSPMFHYRVNSAQPLEATLRRSPLGADSRSTVRGRVVDHLGKPIANAVIQICGAHRAEGWQSGGWADIESIALTDERGTFAIRGEQPFIDVDLTVEARGFAKSRLHETIRSGAEIHEFKLIPGGSVTGRLLQEDKPVINAAVGLTAIKGDAYNRHLSTTTDREGRFHLSNVPPGLAYHLFGVMESLQERGTLPVRRVRVDEGIITDVGDLELQPAFVIGGTLRFQDGTIPPPNFMITLARTVIEDGYEEHLDQWVQYPGQTKGRFHFNGVPAELVSLFIKGPPFYHVSPRNSSGDPARYRLLGRITGTNTNLLFEIVRGKPAKEPLPADAMVLAAKPLRGAE